jgi:hypothetical protein
MKSYYGRIVAFILVSAALLFPTLDSKAQNRITRDPFANPDLTKRKSIRVERKLSSKSPAEIIRDEAAQLELRATIQNGDWAMANINGTMVEKGGEIDGFRLLKVGEADVLLRKKGIDIILVMKTSDSLLAQ